MEAMDILPRIVGTREMGEGVLRSVEQGAFPILERCSIKGILANTCTH